MAGAASQAGDADPSRAPGLTSGLQGSVNVHRGALLFVPDSHYTKTEFSENCLSPRQQPNIEKNEMWIQMFLFLKSDVTLWRVQWQHFS